MSRHYLIMSQGVFGGDKTPPIDVLLKKLEEADPESAKRLRKVDWVKLKRKLLVQAIQDVAKEQGGRVNKEYDNSSSGYGRDSGKPPQGGEVLGVIKLNSDVQLGFAMQKDGSFHVFQNGRSEPHTKGLQKAVEKRYRELSVEAALTVLQCETKKAKREGSTVFVAKLPQKRRAR